MVKTVQSLIILLLLILSPINSAQVFMQGDSNGDAYALISSKKYGYEVPDCKHAVRHITEEWNPALKKFVFIFTLHRDLDDDRCINTDRQRTEIKTSGSSPDSMVGFHGETFMHRWKFFLDSGFQPSPNFCHIHQIKAGDGPDADSPLMTITPRYSVSPSDKLQLIFTAPVTGETTTLFATDLAPFKGTWVEAYERLTYTERGSYSLVIRRVNDDKILLNYSNDTLALWRESSTYMRPKYGLYRSLNSISYLRDESVLFADFSLQKSATINLPAAPTGLTATTVSGNLIKLSWSDNAKNEDQFRIDHSDDGVTWSYLATAFANSKSYIDTVVKGNNYYRIRSENTSGNSAFSNIASVLTAVNSTSANVHHGYTLVQNYPNPFNPATVISFTIPESGHVTLAVFDLLGSQKALLVNEMMTAGNHSVNFDASRLAGGIYFYRMTAGTTTLTRKLVYLK